MKTGFISAMFVFLLSAQGAEVFATETRPVYRSVSNHALTIYSVNHAELVDQYFDPNRLFASFAIVRMTGVYESNCTSVELSAHLSQSESRDELLTEFSLRDVSGPSETVAVEPRICSLVTRPKDFDLKLEFKPNYIDQHGSRIWRVSTKYGPLGNVQVYEFGVKLDSATGFTLIP